MIDIQKEKLSILSDINNILKNLHSEFPWLVVEIAITMQSRFGEDSTLVKKVFDGVLDDMSEEALDQYAPECLPHEEPTAEVATSIFNFFNMKAVQDVLAKPVFSLDNTQSDECLPWDQVDQDSPMVYDLQQKNANTDKLNLVRKVKMDLKELAFRQVVISKKSEEFKDESDAISILFAALDFAN